MKGSGALPTRLDNAGCDGIEFDTSRFRITCPLPSLEPAGIGGIGRGSQGSTCHAAKIVCDYIMVADALALAMDAVDEFNEFDGIDDEAGFFHYFADHGGGEGFADLDEPAGDGPLTFGGLSSALHEKDLVIVHDHSTDSDQRRRWELSLHDSPNRYFADEDTFPVDPSYDRDMISYGQFINGIWMGTILLILGLVPGVVQKIAEAIASFPGLLVSPYLKANRVKPNLRQPRWFAPLGMAIIAISFIALLAN